MVESVKWVDVVLKGVPYEVNDAFMRQLFLDHGVDYILHGDDPCLLPDGSDAYAAVKKAGRFKMVKRTEGISTTDLVGRMLMCTTRPASSMVGGPSKMHKTFSRRNGQSHDDLIEEADAAVASLGSGHGATADAPGGSGPASNGVLGGTQGPNTGVSTFCPTSRRIRQFSSGRTPAPGARVVYIDGAFDMFHPGHVDALRASRQYGDFLLCGVHTDEAVSTRRGPHLPILSLHERSLSVLACKYVDEVIIGAPARLTPDLLTTFGVSVVVRGTVHETAPPGGGSGAEDDRYASAREAGMLVIMPSPRALTTGQIIERILANKSRYEERNRKKGKSEQNYLAQKTYVSEA
jgi:ethanolamine-phosphate cytidylyltransferase